MATYSRQEFVRQVLIELTAISASEAPSAEDGALIDGRAQQKFEELYEEGLLPFDIDGAIPARYFLPLVAIVALECRGAFGLASALADLPQKAIAANKRLWKLRQAPVASSPAVYY